MTHKTRGLVLTSVKYGDTSLIVHIYTELFGLQSYLVNGVRTAAKKGHGRGNHFQPGSMLDMLVYHNELANLQRIKEYKWAYLYQSLLEDVVKNSVVLFMVELISKTIRQPEPNADLFNFLEDAFLYLDEADLNVTVNYPLYFSLQFPSFFGFRISDEYSEEKHVLELKEGEYLSERPLHPDYLDGQLSFMTSELLKVLHPKDLGEVKIGNENRRVLLKAYIRFFELHISDFGVMKTLPVLQAVLGS